MRKEIDMRYVLQRFYNDCAVMPWARIREFNDPNLAVREMEFLKGMNGDRKYRVLDYDEAKVVGETD